MGERKPADLKGNMSRERHCADMSGRKPVSKQNASIPRLLTVDDKIHPDFKRFARNVDVFYID